jgi:hypothetical protein
VVKLKIFNIVGIIFTTDIGIGIDDFGRGVMFGGLTKTR